MSAEYMVLKYHWDSANTKLVDQFPRKSKTLNTEVILI